MTDNPELPDEVRQFIVRYIDSVAELEGLLLMRRDRDVRWDVPALVDRLYIRDEAAGDVLRALVRNGLVTSDDEVYRYAPESAELTAAVDSVAALYPKLLIPITNLIHAKPRAAVQGFADAFRLRDTK